MLLERPIYEHKDNSFGIIRYDFNKEVIQVLIFKSVCYSLKTITEIPFSKAGDMINLRLIISPFALVKHDVHNDAAEFLWPKETNYEFERNESLNFQDDGKLHLTKWIEDPEYREEIIVRDAIAGQIIERSPGYLRRMPDGSMWKMTSK